MSAPGRAGKKYPAALSNFRPSGCPQAVLVFAEEGPVDPVLEPEREPGVPGERPPHGQPRAVAEVEDQQEAALRSERSQRRFLQGGEEVVAQDRRLPDRVDADLRQLPSFKGDAIPP